MRLLAVDFGLQRIGIAISDQGGSIARPLTLIRHTSIRDDAVRVAALALEQNADRIIVGQSFEESGQPNSAGRRAARLAGEIQKCSGVPVVLWDESLSTRDAAEHQSALGVRRRARRRPVDDRAAAVILQSYLDRPPHDR